MVEELVLSFAARGDHGNSDVISERLMPHLILAKTYAEIGMVSAPEIGQGVATATAEASDLADLDWQFAPLLSLLRRLREAVNNPTG